MTTSHSPQYLIDTGWIIRHLRGHQAYTDRLDMLRPDGLAVSMISVAELYEGVALARDAAAATSAIQAVLAKVQLFPVDEETCRQFGILSARFRRKGNHPGDFDVMIAATAVQHNLTVLTTDKDDFSRFEDLRIIVEP